MSARTVHACDWCDREVRDPQRSGWGTVFASSHVVAPSVPTDAMANLCKWCFAAHQDAVRHAKRVATTPCPGTAAKDADGRDGGRAG